MTKEEFITMYCENSDCSRAFFDKHFLALECACGEGSCEGWAAVNKNQLSIKTHNDLYAPSGVEKLIGMKETPVRNPEDEEDAIDMINKGFGDK